MIKHIFNSRKVLAGSLLAVVLGTASIAAIAGDYRQGMGGKMEGEMNCQDDNGRPDRGYRMDRDDDMGMPGMGRDQGMGMSGMGMGHGMMGMGRMGGGRDFAFRGLDLTDEQRASMTSIQDKMRKQHWALMVEMMDAQNTIRDLYEAKTFDEKALNKAYGKVAELQQKMFMAASEARTHMFGLLTAEQRQQLQQSPDGKKPDRS
jgi:Spy/CpxP family protein refolding chaperone